MVSIDTSGLDAFENLHRTLARSGIRLVVSGLTSSPGRRSPAGAWIR
jgi:hypothetical protein